jgi:N-acetylmuramoyl-L-alanine amidase
MNKTSMKNAEAFGTEGTGTTFGSAPNQGKPKSHSLRILAGLASALCCMVLASGCATSAKVKDTTHTFDTVVIDPGHGGKDTGTWSKSRRVPFILEKNAALDVATRLNTKLRADGFKTVMTRRSDVFIELNERAHISNAQTNAIFVSIHFNDSPKRGIQGAETYYHSSASIPLAQKIERNLGTIRGLTPRGVLHANFRVLKLNEYPAVLVECGYLSNRSESICCAKADYRDHLAEKIADGIYEQRHGTTVRPEPAAPATNAAPPSEAQ